MNYYLKGFQNFVQFNGRATRSEYWFFFLFHVLAIIVFITLAALVPRLVFLLFLYYLVSLLPLFALRVRRMHDTGNSGWCMLIPIYSFILLLSEGTNGPNEYGADPKGNGDEMFHNTLDGHLS